MESNQSSKQSKPEESGALEGSERIVKPPTERPIRRVSKLPPPAAEIAGTHSPPPPAKPLQRPEWPALFPIELRLRASVVIGEGISKFQVNDRILEFCRNIISGIAPRVYEIVEKKQIQAPFALGSVQNLVDSYIRANGRSAEEMERVRHEALVSEEWVAFVGQLERIDIYRQSNGEPQAAISDKIRQLVSFRLAEAHEEFQRGYNDRVPSEPQGNQAGQFVKWADIHLERAHGWAKVVHTTWLEILDKHRIQRTPEFLRDVLKPEIASAVESKLETAKFKITTTATAARLDLPASLLDHLAREKGYLIGRWTRKIEIEALDLQLQLEQQTTAPDSPKKGDSDRWESLGAEFRDLAIDESGQPRAKPDNGYLRALCDYESHPQRLGDNAGEYCLLDKPEFGLWTLAGGPGENFRARFEKLATRAGKALGSPRGAESFEFWLHNLSSELLKRTSRYLRGGRIEPVTEASATYCEWLEREAEEHQPVLIETRRPAEQESLRPTTGTINSRLVSALPDIGMSDPASGHWRDHANQFRALQIEDNPADQLRASWKADGWYAAGDQWFLSGGTDRIHARFKLLVESAALELGQPRGRAALDFWLNLLKIYSRPNFRVRGPLEDSETIERVCEASAEYCLGCEARETTKRGTRAPGAALPATGATGPLHSGAEDHAVAQGQAEAEAPTLLVTTQEARGSPGKIKAKYPRGFDGLGEKHVDMSGYYASVGLTPRQRDCFSLRKEYNLPLAEVAGRLRIDRKTADEHIQAATRKINLNRGNRRDRFGRVKKVPITD